MAASKGVRMRCTSSNEWPNFGEAYSPNSALLKSTFHILEDGTVN